jgi:hypothetical protein
MTAALYGPWSTSRPRRSKADIESIRSAIADVLERDHPMTVRQVFYQLVVRDVIEKTEENYKNVVIRLLTDMRMSDDIPFSYIVDKPAMQFVLTLRPLPNVDGIRALRFVLKRLLRQHGMRCVALREERICEQTDACGDPAGGVL